MESRSDSRSSNNQKRKPNTQLEALRSFIENLADASELSSEDRQLCANMELEILEVFHEEKNTREEAF